MTVVVESDKRRVWLAVVLLGSTAFAFVRLRAFLPPPHAGLLGVATAAGAAIVQEAVFRRWLYAELEWFGAPLAVIGTAALFALFHVPRYGWPVAPIDLGAGLIFGWQRYATGSWTAPAATHVLANLVQLW
jgi:membrane protease YdiL (CAAX protease family)